jgi:hypothetical protein
LDLAAQGVASPVRDYVGFYYPAGTVKAMTENALLALKTALAEPLAKEIAKAGCFDYGDEELAYLPPEGEAEIEAIEKILKWLGHAK